MRLWRNNFISSRPGSSSPMAPTGSTFTPKSARLLTALAPPPGTTVRSRCFRISTGASRDSREISPNTNSSATKSPSTVMVTLGNASIIFRSRSAPFKCFVIRFRGTRRSVAVWGIFSRVAAPFLNHAQHGIHGISGVRQLHLYPNHHQRRERCQISSQVHGIFFCGDEAARLTALPKLQQVANILLGVGVMIAEESLGDRINTRSPQLQQKVLRPRNATEHNRPSRNVLRHNPPPHPPHGLARQRKRFRRSAAGQHYNIGPFERSQRFPQPSCGKQTIARIVGSDEPDLEIAS